MKEANLPTDLDELVGKFRGKNPQAQVRGDLVYSLEELSFVAGYFRIKVEAAAVSGITRAKLTMSSAETLRTSRENGRPEGSSAYVFDGLLSVRADQAPEDWVVTFETGDGHVIRLDHQALLEGHHWYNAAIHTYFDHLRGMPPGEFLEIGGRGDVSAGVRANLPPGWRYRSLDVLPGHNVDIVGDIHRLSQVVPPGSIDVVYSSSVFEHLKQPWLAAIEINKVLRIGGLVFTDAPHAFPLHAKPWDFWRYTPWTWQQIFSPQAGFEIPNEGVGLYQEGRMVPLVMRDWNNRQCAAQAGCWLGTACVARKVGETTLRWDGYDDSSEILYPYISDFKVAET